MSVKNAPMCCTCATHIDEVQVGLADASRPSLDTVVAGAQVRVGRPQARVAGRRWCRAASVLIRWAVNNPGLGPADDEATEAVERPAVEKGLPDHLGERTLGAGHLRGDR